MSHGIDNYGNRAQKEIYATNHTLDSKRLPIAYEEWERHASTILEEGPYGYISSGAGAEQTLAANTEEFKRWRILPRMLQDVSLRDLSIPLFGQALPSPVLLAPIGLQIIAHPHGELATAKAAAAEGVPFTASTVSSYSLEEIAEVMEDQPRWFQLYWSCDEEVTRSMVQRAEKAGYSAIVLTVDTPLVKT